MAAAFTKQLALLLPLLPAVIPCLGQANTLSVQEIVHRSAQATQQDWQRAPEFDYCQLDQAGKVHRTYLVSMIEGSPYSRLVAINGQDLPADARESEARKQAAEVQRRQDETADQHRKRVAQYERERRRDQLLLGEFTDAMDFSLAGSAVIGKHETYVLDAKPRPGYVPKSMETKVLTGMRGRLWVDYESFRWVKVEAETFRPVSIEGFLARVEPGTHFELEELPVGDSAGTWLMSHFEMQAHAKILFVFPKSSMEDSLYFQYKPNGKLGPEACRQE
jgi:hypothetical protein